MNLLQKLFQAGYPIIGALHFMPLLGTKNFSSLDTVLKNAIQDANALERGGVNGIIVENNYDIPHKILVDSETIAAMTYLTTKVAETTKLNLGVSVLWNDYKAAFSIAKVIGGSFIRIPAFVDDVLTSYGKVNQVAKEALIYKKQIHAENILIFADVHVKHSQMIDQNKSLEKSIKEAVANHADAIIITGNWTGDSPKVDELMKSKQIAKTVPIILGSGVNKDNIHLLKKYSDAAIVGTSLKAGHNKKKGQEVNIKNYNQRIEIKKVKNFVKSSLS